MTIVFMGSENLALIYSLIGLECIIVNSAKEAINQLDNIFGREDVDVLVIEEKLYRELKNLRYNLTLREKVKPIVMVIPSLDGTRGSRTLDIYNLISEAVGVKLELER